VVVESVVGSWLVGVTEGPTAVGGLTVIGGAVGVGLFNGSTAQADSVTASPRVAAAILRLRILGIVNPFRLTFLVLVFVGRLRIGVAPYGLYTFGSNRSED
jgi:hypothetical protein